MSSSTPVNRDAHAGRSRRGHARRKRWFQVHAAVWTAVNAAFLAVWALSAGEPAADVAARQSGFWPGWVMLLTAIPLSVHGLYVFARRPVAAVDAPRGLLAGSGRRMATVLFTDIVGSTERLHELGDRRWGRLLDEHDRLAERYVTGHGGTLVKRTGDGILAVFNAPGPAIRSAVELRDVLRRAGLHIRVGLHSGEIEVRGDGEDVGGIAVHIASRVMAAAGSGEVLVTRTVHDLVQGSDIRLEDRSVHSLKGIGEGWHLFAALGVES
jgi:class 3 adenylate cyclase